MVPDDLLEIPLAPLPNGAAYPGVSIAVGNLSTPSNIKFEPSVWEGASGLHFKGTDPTTRTKMQSTGYHTTAVIGRNAGFIKFENIEFQTAWGDGKRIHVWAGIDAPNKPDFIQATVMFVNCSWTCPDIPAGVYGVWALFIDQFDVILIDCVFDTAKLYEHPMYWHAFGELGAYLYGTEVTASGAIGAQLTARPGPMYYADQAKLAVAKHASGPNEDWFHPSVGALVYAKDCTFRDWYQAWSWRGGAGLALQGAGVSMLWEDCRFLDFDDHSSPAVGMTNSGVEHFDPAGVGGEDPAMGDMIFRRCFFYGGPDGGPNWPPLVDMSVQQAAYSTVIARSVRFEDCGLYGDRRRVTLRQVLNDDITVVGCNTPNIAAEASLVWGIDTTFEAQLHINGGQFKPVSQGHTP